MKIFNLIKTIFVNDISRKRTRPRCGICAYCDLKRPIYPFSSGGGLCKCQKYKDRYYRVLQSDVCADFKEAERSEQ